MGGVYRFLKSTIVGGLVVLVPVTILGAVLAWAIPMVEGESSSDAGAFQVRKSISTYGQARD